MPKQEKALMLDMGRKFFSKKWIMNLIDYMHELKMNTLQLHFSENEGFRIECETYPQIVSEEHLSKNDIREIIAYANAKDIQIIPDFDTPGHLRQILTFFPEFQLEKNVNGELVKDPRSLNIADRQARDFIKTIYQEYAELFTGSKYFHIGADEFIEFDKVAEFPQLVEYAKEHYGEEAGGMETYIEYTNEIIEYVIELGFIPRVWNDGFYRKNRQPLLELDPRVEICYWTKWDKNMTEAVDFINRGYKIINFNDNYFYYVLGENAGYTYPTAERIRKEWYPEKFSSGQADLTAEEMKAVIGTSFAIWCDRPQAQTEEEVFEGIKEPLKAMMEKLV